MTSRHDSHTVRSTVGSPLLTIAIPTYNRARYLELCLVHLSRQYRGHEQDLDLIVSDNHSTDDTEKVVESFIAKGLPIRYVKQNENIGADKNFADCFARARGKYVLIFGDDDIFLDRAISSIITVLKNGDYGNVYINSYGYQDDHVREMPTARQPELLVYEDPAEYLSKINYWISFSSGNIVNKSLIESDIDPMRFIETNMVQLNWILSAILKAKNNAYLEEYLVAYKVANTGGYRLCQVFGVNINKIFTVFIRQGTPRRYFDIINRKLLNSFFPSMLMTLRRNNPGFTFNEEDHFSVLYPVFRRYPQFWLFVVPIIKLPLPLATLYHRITTTFFKLVKQ
jgi:abequosyltransferase